MGRNTYGHLHGSLYTSSLEKGDVTHWMCRNRNECNARLTSVSTGRYLLVRKEGNAHDQSHRLDAEEVEARRLVGIVKREACEHVERPPTAVMRLASSLSAAVQAHLPEKDNIRKALTQERAKQLTSNPMTTTDLHE